MSMKKIALPPLILPSYYSQEVSNAAAVTDSLICSLIRSSIIQFGILFTVFLWNTSVDLLRCGRNTKGSKCCLFFFVHREKKQPKQDAQGCTLSPTLYGIKHARMSLIIAVAFRTGTLLSSQSCSVKFKHFFPPREAQISFVVCHKDLRESVWTTWTLWGDSQVTTT